MLFDIAYVNDVLILTYRGKIAEDDCKMRKVIWDILSKEAPLALVLDFSSLEQGLSDTLITKTLPAVKQTLKQRLSVVVRSDSREACKKAHIHTSLLRDGGIAIALNTLFRSAV